MYLAKARSRLFCVSTRSIIQSKASRWRYDGYKHARAATRKTTLPDTSFTIAGASAYSLMLCLSCQSSSTYSVSRSRAASRLFVPLVPRCTSGRLLRSNPWLVCLTSSLCAVEIKTEKENSSNRSSLIIISKIVRGFIHACLSLKANEGGLDCGS